MLYPGSIACQPRGTGRRGRLLLLTLIPCITSWRLMLSNRRRRMKWWTCFRKHLLLCSWIEASPQNSLGMTFDITAWQNAETLDAGVERSVREVYCRCSAGTSDGRDLFRPFAGFGVGDGLEETTIVVFDGAGALSGALTCPGTGQ